MKESMVAMLAETIWKSTPRPGRCFRCERLVDQNLEFRDTLGLKEWHISHLCQQCQDLAFQDESED